MKKIISILALLSIFTSAFAAKSKAFMMQPEGSLYTENDNGELVWKLSVHVGAELTVLSEKDTKRTINGKLVDCHAYEVSYEDKKYYALSDRVSVQENFGIIANETAVYRSADYADVYDRTFKIGTFVTYGSPDVILPKNTSLKNPVDGFRQVSYFETGSYTVKTVFVKQVNVQNAKDDLKSLKLFARFNAAKDDNVRAELFASFSKLTTSKGVKAMFEEENLKLISKDLSSGGKESVNKYMSINNPSDSPINVRSLPGTSGEVVRKINKGEILQVYVQERTKLKGSANNTVNHWYLVQFEDGGSVAYGWIYGDFLK